MKKQENNQELSQLFMDAYNEIDNMSVSLDQMPMEIYKTVNKLGKKAAEMKMNDKIFEEEQENIKKKQKNRK